MTDREHGESREVRATETAITSNSCSPELIASGGKETVMETVLKGTKENVGKKGARDEVEWGIARIIKAIRGSRIRYSTSYITNMIIRAR